MKLTSQDMAGREGLCSLDILQMTPQAGSRSHSESGPTAIVILLSGQLSGIYSHCPHYSQGSRQGFTATGHGAADIEIRALPIRALP